MAVRIRPCAPTTECSLGAKAPDLGSGDRWFESSHSDHLGDECAGRTAVLQTARQGSIPWLPTNLQRYTSGEVPGPSNRRDEFDPRTLHQFAPVAQWTGAGLRNRFLQVRILSGAPIGSCPDGPGACLLSRTSEGSNPSTTARLASAADRRSGFRNLRSRVQLPPRSPSAYGEKGNTVGSKPGCFGLQVRVLLRAPGMDQWPSGDGVGLLNRTRTGSTPSWSSIALVV